MNDAATIPAGPALSEWYFFAVFVFLLAALLIWFYKRTPRSQKKREEKSFEREAKLFKLYQNIEDLMDGFEEYVEELQNSFRLESGEVKRRVEALETQHAHIRHALRELSARASEPRTPYEAQPEPFLEPQEPYEAQPGLFLAPEAPYEERQGPFEEPKEAFGEAAPPPNAAAPAETEAERSPGPERYASKKGQGASAEPLNRAQKVRILQDEGLSAVHIAKELGLSLNEVSLIIQLDERPDLSLH